MGWFAFLGPALSIVNKLLGFLPSKDYKAGRAEADLRHVKETEDARQRMEDVRDPGERDTIERLRDKDF